MSEKKISAHEMERLAVLAQDGDGEAFGELYDALVGPIYRYCYYRVGREEAEDLTELTFLKTWEHLEQYRKQKGNPFSAWVFRIAHNVVVDHYRSFSKHETLELSEEITLASELNNPEADTQLHFDQRELKTAIRKLPEMYQQIIVLKFVNDFKNEEIARIIGKSVGSVRILQFRALSKLKELLAEFDRAPCSESEIGESFA